MPLKIYNTLTRKKEEFKTLEKGKVRMYVCGPTVYDRAHVGHAMSSIVFDVMRRYLEYCGFQVRHVMNYTDVDDKVIRRANELGVDPLELAEGYIEEYEQHLKDLRVLPADKNPRVSKEIENIIEMVAALIDKGFAYTVEGDVYFSVAKDKDYGKLSRRKPEDMQAGFRVELNERKQAPEDFALWKAGKPGEPAWDSPWGPGRPGWHIECSVMAKRHLGDEIDIHGGGNDLIFPHHENEIAQTESITGKPFATYWAHNGMLQIGGEAMSKSVGNMVTVEEFLAEHEGDVLRMMVLNGSYSAPLTFTGEVVDQAEKALGRLRAALRPSKASQDETSGNTIDLLERAQVARQQFENSMDDDFNSPGALASMFELVRSINQARDAGADDSELQPAQATLKSLAGLLGLDLEATAQVSSDATDFINMLVALRDELRNENLWQLADLIRDQLSEKGVVVEDGQSSSTWRFK